MHTASGKRAPIHADYTLHDQILTRVKSAKYLGVTLTDNMKWDQYINNICDNANRTIGFLRQNLSIGATSVKERAYFALVRPLVEYASTVWGPHTQTSIKKIAIWYNGGLLDIHCWSKVHSLKNPDHYTVCRCALCK